VVTGDRMASERLEEQDKTGAVSLVEGAILRGISGRGNAQIEEIRDFRLVRSKIVVGIGTRR
jgi:hypothetical protein